MNKIFVIAFMIILAVSAHRAAAENSDCATKWFCNQELSFDCQEFYNDSHYYTIAKWISQDGILRLDEQNTMYRHYNTNAEQIGSNLTWKSSPYVQSVLATFRDEQKSFEGGKQGSIELKEAPSELVFCGYKSRANTLGVQSSSAAGSGVPEFPALTAAIAVILVTLGIVFLRKN